MSERKEHLGIANFGLSVTTLEDVFLKVGSKAEDTAILDRDEEPEKPALARMPSVDSQENTPVRMEERRLHSGVKLWLMQMKGLVVKRMIQTSRNWFLYLIMVGSKASALEEDI